MLAMIFSLLVRRPVDDVDALAIDEQTEFRDEGRLNMSVLE